MIFADFESYKMAILIYRNMRNNINVRDEES